MNTMFPYYRHYLFQDKVKNKKTTRAQEDVVSLKECGEFVWVSVFQEALNGENDDEV